MKLIGTVILGALLTLLRMLTGFIVTKFVAVSIGPTGVALLGQLQSFVAGINGLIANQIGQGIVRFTAEHKDHGYDAMKPWWSAAVSLLLFTVIFTLCILTLMSQQLATWLFSDEKLYWVVIVVGVSLPLNALNSVSLNVLNGLGENKRYIYISMISVCITTIVSLLFLYFWGLYGGLLAVAINNSVAAIVVLSSVYKSSWFKFHYWMSTVDRKKRKIFFGYMLMGVVGALTGPAALIFIRNMISFQISTEAAGLWQAASRVSDAYIAIFTIGIGMYYFPKVAAIHTSSELKKETKYVVSRMFPFLVVAVLSIYGLRDFIIKILYSHEFYSARELFVPQLIGDMFRLISFVPASILLAKGYFKLNAAAEVVVNSLFVVFSYFLLKVGCGLISVNMAYAMIYVCYFIFSVFFFFYHCRNLDKIGGV